MRIVDLLEIVQVDEGHRQRPAMAAGAQEFLFKHGFELAAVEHAGQGIAMGLVGQALGTGLEFIGATAGLVGILQFAQVAQGCELLGVVDQLAHAGRRIQAVLEQAGDVRQRIADPGQDLVEAGTVQLQPVVDLLQGALAGGIGVFIQPDVGNGARQLYAGLEWILGGTFVFAVADAVDQVTRQAPLLGYPCTDVGVAAAEFLALARDQVGVVARFAQQRQVAFGFGLGQAQHAHVLQQPSQHQLLQPAQAARLAELAGGQRAEDAALPGALAQVVVGAAFAGQALGDGEAQGEADRSVQPEHGQRLAEVLDPAPAGVQRRIGDAQHAGTQRHVDGDDVRSGCDVRFRVLGQFDDAQGNTGRRGEVAAKRQCSCQLGRHVGSFNSIRTRIPRNASQSATFVPVM
ncbi:hypothetical protein D3C72_1010430 [compost metagenome]